MNAFFTLLLSTVCFVTQAQTADTGLDAYWNINLTKEQKLNTVLLESQTAISNPAAALNTITLQQNGIANQAILQTSGSQNLLEVSQFNNGNMTNATLSGLNNSLIIGQTGGGNMANIDLSGTNNRFLVTQDGGDRVNMLGLQKENTRLELTQGSGNNSFTLDNTTLFKDPLSQGIPNLRIEQSGGANVTIQQGKVIGN
ncbi:hypothetical protein GCM10028818_14410 [Spirosoma horti]